jgi:membrane protease YdiL (CAAX protease family)
MPLLLFVCLYVATLIGLASAGLPFIHATALMSVIVATSVTVALWEKGRWTLGLAAPPRVAAHEFLRGVVWGATLIVACSMLVVATTDVHHVQGNGFPWFDLLTLFLPAVLHEELLFRGYPFQKLLQWNRTFALLFMAIVFAAVHTRNIAVSEIGVLNIFLGGLLLGLAYERARLLWFPIGLHLAWNLTTGPVLGDEVSGYQPLQSLLVETGSGPNVLTGGDFGIEGSLWLTVVEVAAIALLSNMIRARGVFDARQKE